MNETVLEAKSLRRTADGDALDLTLCRGEIVALLGTDEQEKSRWLRVLAGLHRAAGGTLRICGEEVRANGSGPHRKSGYLSAGAPLLSTFDVVTNVMLPRLYHFDEAPDDARRQALDLLERSGFSIANTLPAWLDRLSSFQAMLARALATDPELLFIHEPFEIGLAPHWREMEATLAQSARNRALVVATQNLGFARRRAGKIVFVEGATARLFDGWEGFRAGGRKIESYLATMPLLFEDSAA